jgi:hypothetical protein
VDLKMTFDQNGSPEVTSVTGSALFYVVRGDSALIPSEFGTRFRGDSTRWWIERWEDETAGASSPASAQPVGRAARHPARPNSGFLPPGPATWGQVKTAYF